MTSATKAIDVVRVSGRERSAARDRAAAEEPLAIRLQGRPFAVIMRTPGADRELAAGFLFAERIIRGADDLGTIAHCRDAAAENTIDVSLVDAQRAADALDSRRSVLSNSSCGVCGRRTVDALAADLEPIQSSLVASAATIAGLPDRLRGAQCGFDETGGLHAAGLFDAGGALLDVAEDVGRHNAVDKVVGRALIREQLPMADAILCVSGRTSFEIVQKAAAAGVPIVAAVSAPSSLAIELAERFGITLVGFVRGGAFNVYAGVERIV